MLLFYPKIAYNLYGELSKKVVDFVCGNLLPYKMAYMV